MVDAVLILAIGVIGSFLTLAYRKLFPRHYFSMASLVNGDEAHAGLTGVILRAAIPFVAGLVAYMIWPDSHVEGAALSGAMISILLVWSSLLAIDTFPGIGRADKVTLGALYLIFIVSYSLLAILGAKVADLIGEPNLITLGSTGATFFVGVSATSLYRRLLNHLTEK